ncbi:MAG: glycosyltransferase, partial [Candidatus Omnitrophota bacterium]|nr:glycosyltransferase [Candidatus Omnitrophota bacterium]
MNILFLTTHLNIGGITSYVLALAKGLKAKGHQVYVASSGGEVLPMFQEAGITYLRIPVKTKCEFSPKVIPSFFKLVKEVKGRDIDLLHANTRVTQVLAYLASRSTGRPYVSTCHGFFKTRFSRRLFPCWGRKVIAISAQVRDHLIGDFKLDAADIQVIHNGVDVNRFGSQVTLFRGQASHKSPFDSTQGRQVKEKFGLGEGPVVGIIARLSDVKGHVYLITAMQEVLKNTPASQLLIV